MPPYTKENEHKRPSLGKKYDDLLIKRNKVVNINVANCIGATKDLFKLQQQLDDALCLVEFYGGQLEKVRDSYTIIKIESDRLKLELKGRKLN